MFIIFKSGRVLFIPDNRENVTYGIKLYYKRSWQKQKRQSEDGIMIIKMTDMSYGAVFSKQGGTMKNVLSRILILLSSIVFFSFSSPVNADSGTASPSGAESTVQEEASSGSAKGAGSDDEIESEASREINYIRESLQLPKRKNVLVAYFSRVGENPGVGVITKGNTRIVAEEIAKQTRGTLFEIRTVKDYPESYEACLALAKKEQAKQLRPELAENIDITPFDEIYLGSPVWNEDMPMAVYTFLEGHDFNGKVIRPFNTHEGSGDAGFVDKIRGAAKNAVVKPIFSVRGGMAQYESFKLPFAVKTWRTAESIRQSEALISNFK